MFSGSLCPLLLWYHKRFISFTFPLLAAEKHAKINIFSLKQQLIAKKLKKNGIFHGKTAFSMINPNYFPPFWLFMTKYQHLYDYKFAAEEVFSMSFDSFRCKCNGYKMLIRPLPI